LPFFRFPGTIPGETTCHAYKGIIMKVGLLLVIAGLVLTLIFPPAGILLTGFGLLWFAVALVAKLLKIGVKTGARAVSATASAVKSGTAPT
jgi:hypothetical protein